MGGTEKEVAFRKRRRDYSKIKRRNHIRENTEIIRIPGQKVFRPESVLARTRLVNGDRNKVRINKSRKPSANFPQPEEEDQFCIVIRIVPKGHTLCKESFDILTSLRLVKQFDARFVRLTDDIRQQLKAISHLVAFGTPSPEVIARIIHSRGAFASEEGEKLIQSNHEVMEALPGTGIETINEIVDTLSECNQHFDAVADKLATLHLAKVEVKKPTVLVSKGGMSGWRGEAINEFVLSML